MTTHWCGVYHDERWGVNENLVLEQLRQQEEDDRATYNAVMHRFMRGISRRCGDWSIPVADEPDSRNFLRCAEQAHLREEKP